MNRFNNEKLKKHAQSLRKNMTKEERHLWYDFLKNLPLTIHRQKVIGQYIVDFYIAESKIVLSWMERSILKRMEKKKICNAMLGYNHRASPFCGMLIPMLTRIFREFVRI